MPTVTLKLTDTEAELLDQLRRHARTQSRSDTLRRGLMLLAASHKLKKSAIAKVDEERTKHAPRYRVNHAALREI
jgi:Arc/MetJ-type ribon-helix-helix transcriptional regulator